MTFVQAAILRDAREVRAPQDEAGGCEAAECEFPNRLVSWKLPTGNRSGGELTTQFVLDVNPDDVVEGLFRGGEAERRGPLGVEIARPAIDNAHDERIRLTLDPPRDLVAGHPLQRGDLLADRGRQAGHREVAARTRRRAIHSRGMDQETDRGARRGM